MPIGVWFVLFGLANLFIIDIVDSKFALLIIIMGIIAIPLEILLTYYQYHFDSNKQTKPDEVKS